VRPIEIFWAFLKGRACKNVWTAKNIEKLIRKIKFELKKMSTIICQNLMSGLKRKVRKTIDNGVLLVIN
jgi:hypothetical protein